MTKSVSAEINYGCRFINWVMARDFLEVFVPLTLEKVEKKKRRPNKITLKVNYRADDAPFEPSKYGGKGMCESTIKSTGISIFYIIGNFKFTLVIGDRGDIGPITMINHAWRMMTELSLEPWNIRGIGIMFDLKQEIQDTREIHEIWEKRRLERSADSAHQRFGFLKTKLFRAYFSIWNF